MNKAFSLNKVLRKALSKFDKTTLRRGEKYYKESRIQDVSITEEDDHVLYNAKAYGSGRIPYDVDFFLFDDNAFEAICDCPMGEHCKHIAALMLELLAEDIENDQLAAKKNSSGVARIIPLITQENTRSVQSLLEKIAMDAQQPTTYFPVAQQKSAANHTLLYMIKTQRRAGTYIQDEITLSLARKLKAGGFGQPQTFRFHSEVDARCLTPEDLPIIAFFKLIDQRREASKTEYAETILEKIVASGRCYYQTVTAKPLQLGESKTLEYTWTSDKNGQQQLQLHVDHQDHQPVELFFMMNPWYIQTSTQKIGRLQTAVSPAILKSLYCMPPLNIIQAGQIAKVIKKKQSDWQLPVPLTQNQAQELTQEKPVYCLYLSAESLSRNEFYRREQEPIECTLGKLYFRYGTFQVSWDEPEKILYRKKDEKLFAVHRHQTAEQAAVNMLTAHQLSTVNVYSDLAIYRSVQPFLNYFLIEDPMNFSMTVLPELRQQGFQVEFSENYPFNIVANEETEWYSQIVEEDRSDWFNLELGVFINGEKLNLLPILQNIMAEFTEHPQRLQEFTDNPQAMFHVRLLDKRLLPVPFSRIKHIMDILLELQEGALTENQQLQLSNTQLMCLAELEKAFAANELRWLGGERLRGLAERLRNFQGIQKINAPQLFHGTLRDYQQEGLNWLQFLREYELAGILADEMGLGKTVQMLAHIAVEKTQGRLTAPCLVIAPTSLMYNWHSEAQQFTPDLKVLISQGKQRKETFDAIQAYDVILTTYPLLFRDRETLLAHDYHLLILDEAQMVKNNKTQASAIVQQIKAKHRLCMTGTPLENHLGELWSLFHFLMPGLLGNERAFKRFYRTPIEKHQNKERFAQLRTRTAPFLLRRTKTMVATELPPKTEIIHHVELEDAQRDLYETVRLQMQQKVAAAVEKNGLNRSHITILDALLKLRQICCDPALLKIKHIKTRTYPSAKLDSLLELMDKLRDDGRRILLFSQFTEMLALIEKAVQKRGIPYVKLTGSTVDRHTPIKTFQAEKVPLFLISLKAGGVGLNLTAADTVIHYDPWWNPAVEQQATDRTHRLGQTKNVFVYKFIAVGTVEEKIIALQQRKKVLLDGIFSDQNQQSSNLTLADLKYLFA